MDVFKPFLQRLAQPIILSFCIAWIFWNWEISVGFFKYTSETLPKYGYKNYKELICKNNDVWSNYFFPVISAFLYPVLRYGLNLFNTIIRTEERTKLLDVSGAGKMSTLKFLELKKSYDEKVAALSEYFEEQSEIQKRANENDTALITIKSELQKANEENQNFQQVIEDLKHKELVRSDDTHTAQMTLQELKDRSSPTFLISEYMLNIVQYQNKKALNSTNILATISNDNDNIVFHIDNKDIAVLTHYFYNVNNDTCLVYFSQEKEQFIMFNRYLILEANNVERSFKSEVITDHFTFKINLKKV